MSGHDISIPDVEVVDLNKAKSITGKENGIIPSSPESSVTMEDRLQSSPELKNQLIQTKAPKQNKYAFPQSGGGYDKASGLGMNIGKRPVSNMTLRRVARESGLLAAIVSRRDFQMNMIAKEWLYEGDIGFKIGHRKEHDPDFVVPPEFKVLCEKVTEMVEAPFPAQKVDGIYYPAIEKNFRSFCSKYIKDLMVINRPCVEIKRAPNGMPIAFSVVDGANVFPTHDGINELINPETNQKISSGKVPDRGTDEYRGFISALSEKYGTENLNERTDYVYVQDGIPITGYTYEELMVRPVFESSETHLFGYPPSMVESALVLIIGELQAMSYELSYFEFGTMIDTIIGIVGSHGDNHIEEITQHLKDNHSGSGNAHKTPVLPIRTGDDIKIMKLKEGNNDMRFGELLTTLTGRVCAIFGMNPEEINVINRAGGGGTQFSGNRGQEMMENKEEGIYTNRSEIRECVNDIIREIDPNLNFEWKGLNTDSEDRKNKNIQDDLNGGKITIREARVRSGKPPVPEGLKPADVDVFLNPVWAQIHAANQMAEQQAEMAKQENNGDDDDGEPKDYTVDGDDDHEEALFEESEDDGK